jgi:hypothetical protein
MADEQKLEPNIGQPDLHPDCAPLMEAMILTRNIPHSERMGCLVMLFRGKQFRLIMDDSLNLDGIVEALERVIHDMKNQKPIEVDADTPLTGGETPKLQ